MTIEDFVKQRTCLEEKHQNSSVKLGWDYTDVLYSFLGVYVIGLRVYYPEYFIAKGITIRPINDNKQNAYSKKFFKKHFANYNELNEKISNSGFLDKYSSLGNITPIWPGGNTHKGQSKCFDIPDLYFKKSRVRKCAEAFFSIKNLNCFLELIFEGKYYLEKETSDFMKFTKEEYGEFLKHIVLIIEYREKKLQEILNSIN